MEYGRGSFVYVEVLADRNLRPADGEGSIRKLGKFSIDKMRLSDRVQFESIR